MSLISCRKQLFYLEQDQLKVNLMISRQTVFPETRATVKDSWADGDVVFVFFADVASPKYLEMKYNKGSWVSTPKNGLKASDLSDSGEMTAIYLPYGSDLLVVNDNGSFKFTKSGEDYFYTGWFLLAEKVIYTFDSELHGSISLEAPVLDNRNSLFVHFDISGVIPGNEYEIYQDYVRPIALSHISASGVVTHSEGEMGKAIPGYMHTSSIVSFSGILDASAVGSLKDYQFSVNDKTASILYTRNAGKKSVASSKYIGIGNLKDLGIWKATKYVYLGINNSEGKKLCWAIYNLGSDVERGEGSYGDYYAWGGTDGYALSGTFEGGYTSGHDFKSQPYYEVDANRILKLEYDAAHVLLSGLWRIPSRDEWIALADNTECSYSENASVDYGIILKSKVEGYKDRSLFLPAAGVVKGFQPTLQGSSGAYWASNEIGADRSAVDIWFGSSADYFVISWSNLKEQGQSIRPVFTID